MLKQIHLKLKKRYTPIFIGFLFTWMMTFLVDPQVNSIEKPIERIEGIIYDLRLNATLDETPRTGEHNIFIVDIDEKALKEIGRWPWSRLVVKDMVEKLVDAGVAVVGFDVIFAEPEPNPLDQVVGVNQLSQLTEQDKQDIWQALDADGQFASILSEYDIVLGALFQEQVSVNVGELLPTPIQAPDINPKFIARQSYAGKVSNLDVLQQATNGQGYFNSSPDDDGYIRRATLVVEHQGQFYPSLALETARLYTFEDAISIETEPLGDTGYHSITGLKFGKKNLINTDEHGRVLVPFRGKQKSFPYYSAADIIHQRLDPDLLMGGVALVGTSAVGLADLRATSVGLQYPGVEVHANVLEGLLQPELFSYRPDWWQGSLLIQIIILGVILAILLPILGPKSMALLGFCAVALVVGFNLYMWNNQIELPLTQPLMLVLGLTIYNMAGGFFTENANKQKIKGMFDQYVPPAHIDKMIEDPDSFTFEGERKELSVLFSDIRSFTTISEKLSANELKDMLNEYFTPITKSIFEHQGTIDKYIGDLVMAIWGAPVDVDNHAEAAVIAGFDMLAITARLREEFVAKDWPAIRVGIGVNTGEMNVGDMGSVYRRSYTVLGDSVNLGSRLEGLTKAYGVEFLVSEFTKTQCPNIVFRPVDKVKVKGKDVAVAIFEPVCHKDHITAEIEQEVADLEQAYELYLKQEWAQSKAAYQALAEQYPDRYIYKLYIEERIAALEDQDLGADWDGSFTHTSK